MAHHPGCVITPVGPGKDTHGTLGPVRGKAVGGPNNAPKGEVTRHDASLNHDNRQVLRQKESEREREGERKRKNRKKRKEKNRKEKRRRGEISPFSMLTYRQHRFFVLPIRETDTFLSPPA